MRKILSSLIIMVILASAFCRFSFAPSRSFGSDPSTWIVDDDGPADFSTIQEAINGASDGDTIYVRAGVYYEHLSLIKENISLVGENPHTTIIDGNGTGSCISVTRRRVTIGGFTVQNSAYGVKLGPAGSWSHDNIKMYN